MIPMFVTWPMTYWYVHMLPLVLYWSHNLHCLFASEERDIISCHMTDDFAALF